jgi:ribonuclease E
MKRILINALQKEEIRVAMVDGQQLYDLDIEVPSREQKKANIYKGTITRVEPSLEAAFVDYGAERHGFLPFKEISRSYFSEEARKSEGRPDIKTAVREGQQVVIQVDKEERGNKGAALTTFISLAGRYLVLMPNNPRAGGVSRRIEGEDRQEIREALSHLEVPQGMGLIVRTAGVGRNPEELNWDMDYLLQIWTAIEAAAAERKAPFLIYQESNVIIRALRDYFRTDIGEILIDSPEVFEIANEFITQVMPTYQRKLKLYEDDIPLFNRFQIEGQIESAFQREVTLPSGGAIVIDHTEALISIDINSARATKGSDIEETALNTNLEAADEIARQLRLRDLGGLVVIDFIDMMAAKNQRAVENRLRDALKVDRARVQVGRISRFGLLEMSRQRLRPSLGESTQIVCPRCSGYGTIRSIESLSLSLIRIAEEEALKEHTGRVIIQVPVEVATFMFNEKRDAVNEIQSRTRVEISIIANPAMDTPHYDVTRVRISESPAYDGKSSYQLVESETEPYIPEKKGDTVVAEQPAVKSVQPSAPAPVARKKSEPGLLVKIFRNLFASEEEEDKPAKPAARSTRQPQQRDQGRNEHRRGAAAGGAGTGGSRRGGGGRRRGADSGRADSRSDSRGEGKQQDRSQPKKKQARQQPQPAEAKGQQSAQQSVQPSTQQPAADKDAATQDKPSRRGRRGGRGGGKRRGGRGQDNRPAGDNRSPQAADGQDVKDNAPQQATAPVATDQPVAQQAPSRESSQDQAADQPSAAARQAEKPTAAVKPAESTGSQAPAAAEKPQAPAAPAPSQPRPAAEKPATAEKQVATEKPAPADRPAAEKSTPAQQEQRKPWEFPASRHEAQASKPAAAEQGAGDKTPASSPAPSRPIVQEVAEKFSQPDDKKQAAKADD